MSPDPAADVFPFAPNGSIAAALRWIRLVLVERDLVAAWVFTDPEFRKVLAGAWFDADADHPEVNLFDRETFEDALAKAVPAHALWTVFAAVQLREFATVWSEVDLERWGWATRPRPYTPDHEIAFLTRADGEAFVVEESGLMPGLPFIMHRVPGTGWLVAGLAELVG